MTSFLDLRRTLGLLALFALGTALLAVACPQAPLYYSNQNQYFLHGLARAGVGSLQDDWLARTSDPTPVFTALVAFTVSYLHPALFHVYYALLLGVYGAALLGLFAAVAGNEVAARRWPVFLALVVAVHAALLRWGSYRWLGQDYPYYLQAGVAGQYVLGGMLQPSVFGVLLVVAVCAFAHGRPFLAALSAALAVGAHATYLLPAGLLVLGFLTAWVQEGRTRQGLAAAGLALLGVLPVILFTLVRFAPTSRETFTVAQEVLINVRIPHHTRVDLWYDSVAAAQVGWVILGVVLARPPRLRWALAVPGLLALGLTVVQVATANNSLALLFPWRVSVILVPVATAIVLSRLVMLLPVVWEGNLGRGVSAVVVLACVAGGAWISATRQGFHINDDELPVLEFVRQHREPGDLYFLPVNVPELARSVSGSFSSDFKPLAEKKSDGKVIPVDLQRFRLSTGAPIFVDFKSIPYKDTDVLTWRDRLRLAQHIQAQIRTGEIADALAALRALGVTHLVLPANQELHSPGLVPLHEDAAYRVYRLW